MYKNKYYFDLPYSGQLLIWTSRIYVNECIYYNRNIEDIIIRAYNRLNINNGYIKLANLLSILLDNHLLKMNDINDKLLNYDEYLLSECLEDFKFSNDCFDKYSSWKIENYFNQFKLAANELIREFDKNILTTSFKLNSQVYKKCMLNTYYGETNNIKRQ